MRRHGCRVENDSDVAREGGNGGNESYQGENARATPKPQAPPREGVPHVPHHPPPDDITAQSISKAFNLKYEIHKEAFKILKA